MTALGAKLLERRTARIMFVAALFVLPLASIASAALLVLVTQQRGWRVAAVDAVLATALLAAAVLILQGSLPPVALAAAGTWGVGILLGALSRSGGFVLPFQVSVVLAWLATGVFFAWYGSPDVLWTGLLKEFAGRLAAMGIGAGQTDLLPPLAGSMTGALAASAVVSGLLALFLGTWLGGGIAGRKVREAFAELRLGRIAGTLGLMTGVLAVAQAAGWADDLALVTATAFALQGLAVVHWRAAATGWPAAWPWAVYLPFVLLPALAVMELVLLAVLGLADNLFGFRTRPEGMV